MVKFLLLVLSLITVNTCISQKVNLFFNLPVNSSYKFILHDDAVYKSYDLASPKKTPTINKSSTMLKFRMDVLEKLGEWTSISVLFEELERIDSINGAEFYSGPKLLKHPTVKEKVFNEIFKTIEGSKVTFLINSKGEIENFSGFAPVIEKMKQQAKGQLAVDPDAALQELQLEENIAYLFRHYPDHDIAVKDTWDSKRTLKNIGGNMVAHNYYSFDSLINNKAIIEIKGKITGEHQETSTSTLNEREINGNNEGSLKYDILTGFPEHAKSHLLWDYKLEGQHSIVTANLEIEGKKL